MPPTDQGIQVPPGLLCVTTYGSVQGATVQSLLDLRGYNSAHGINNVHYATVSGILVDKARNESVRGLLGNPSLQYLCFVDADMQFAPDMLHRFLLTAYSLCPWADAVGAYCQLRGKPYLPTIDTGTGTWEPHDALSGPLEVIRTGSACILVKRHVYERMEFPWYGVRPAPRPLDVMAELDNFARVKMDGRNLLREHPAWALLEKCAREDAQSQRGSAAAQAPGGFFSSVGEDSAFCDKLKALDFRIVVQTDVVVKHLDQQVIGPELHISAMKESELLTRQTVGVLL